MKEFKKYQHLERFGTDEVLNIHLGETHIFPKIDGTNGSLWWDNGLQAGSRNRQLTIESDNAGFYQWALQQDNLINLLAENQDLILYGEWLVPHSLKTYRQNAWRKFYIFDVVKIEDSEAQYQHYDEYKAILDHYQVDYIPPLATVKNCNYDKLIAYLESNNFLIEDGKGAGEGIVIKNYSFKNRYGRTTWAKIVTSEFREKHAKEMGAPNSEMKQPIEETIVNEFVTQTLVEKVYWKIRLDNDGFNSRNIPQLLQTVFYDLVREDCWNFIKKHKNPTIDFSALNHLTIKRVKELLPQIFG